MTAPKTVLITGASSGFGRDAAETLARAGYRVFATMRHLHDRNAAHAAALRNLAKEEGLTLQVLELDVTDMQSVERAVAEVLQTVPAIDVLINNAGFGIVGLSEAFTMEQFQAQLDTNLFGIQRLLRAVLPNMRQHQNGLVINISSILGRVTFPFMGVYGASKHAVEALIESYHAELSQLGVEVVLVQPSAYPTEIFQKVQLAADQERVAAYGPVAQATDKLFASISGLFEVETPPNPHEVVEAIQKLIEMPKGCRPLRTTVGYGFGADQINEFAEPIQRRVLGEIGLAELAKLPTQAATV